MSTMAHHQLRSAVEAHVGPLLKHYSPQLTKYHNYVPMVLSPVHKYLPFAALDLVGAMRLSSVVNWIASSASDASPAVENGVISEKGKKVKVKKERASLLQECLGILVVVFGGETFLGESMIC